MNRAPNLQDSAASQTRTTPEKERTKRFISTINAAHTYDI